MISEIGSKASFRDRTNSFMLRANGTRRSFWEKSLDADRRTGRKKRAKQRRKEQMEKKKLTRELEKNSAARAILEYAFFTPAFSRRDIMMAISWRVESVIADAVKKLCGLGYIRQLEPKSKTSEKPFWAITPDGRLYLARQSDYFRINKDRFLPATYKAALKYKTRLSLYAFVHGAGIRIFPTMKPSFASFVSMSNPKAIVSPVTEDDPRYISIPAGQLPAILEDGIFYSTPEIREGLESLGRHTDEFLSTRCLGVVFTGENIFLLYNSQKSAVVMARYTENMFLHMISTVFINRLGWSRKPICLLTGKTYALAPAITMGYVHGRMSYEKQRDIEIREKIKDLPLNQANDLLSKESARLSKAKDIAAKKRAHAGGDSNSRKNFFNAVDDAEYDEIYYVPVGKNHTLTLNALIETDRDQLIESGREWFQSHKGFGYRGAHELVNGDCFLSKTEAAYLPVVDCKALSELRDRTAPVSVVTDPGIADCISHCLGRIAADFYDMDTGEKIEFRRYDEYGYPLGEDRYEKIARINKERNAKRREELSAEKTFVLSFRQKESSRPVWKRLGQELGMKQARLAEELANYILTDDTRTKEFLEYIRKNGSKDTAKDLHGQNEKEAQPDERLLPAGSGQDTDGIVQ